MKLTLTFLAIAIVFHSVTVAQPSATFQVRHYTTENGLPANGIKGIQWDESTGFLWIATEGGLVRFNGIDFKTYTNQNTPFIASERFRFLVRNNKGDIYSADDDENIFKIQRNTPVLYSRGLKATARGKYYAYYGLPVSDSFFLYKVTHPVIVDEDLLEAMPLTDTSVFFIDREKPFAVTLTNDKPLPLLFEDIRIKTSFKLGNQTFLITKNSEL